MPENDAQAPAVDAIHEVGAAPGRPGEAPRGLMKLDLHCHSEASVDCSTPLDAIPARCLARGIHVQAITDHNEVWGAQELKRLVEERGDDLTIIVGEEVSTREGEIIGLFLEEKIEPGLSPEDTVAQIKAQGGLVYLPHGFDPMKRARLRPEALVRIEGSIEIVESFNARISRPRYNRAAVTWAEMHGLPLSAGSDAHTLKDIGSAWAEVPARKIKTPQELLEALAGGVPTGVWTHPAIAFAYKLWDRTRRRFKP